MEINSKAIFIIPFLYKTTNSKTPLNQLKNSPQSCIIYQHRADEKVPRKRGVERDEGEGSDGGSGVVQRADFKGGGEVVDFDGVVETAGNENSEWEWGERGEDISNNKMRKWIREDNKYICK